MKEIKLSLKKSFLYISIILNLLCFSCEVDENKSTKNTMPQTETPNEKRSGGKKETINLMKDELNIDGTKVCLFRGDITVLKVDAIVNAANAALAGGGGVDHAIGMAAGRGIYAECAKILESRGLRQLDTGDAVITSAGKMKDVRYIIHTPGPIWRGGTNGECDLLYQSYKNSLNLANTNGCRSIAFPTISTGIYNFPKDQAAMIAFHSVVDTIKMKKYQPEQIIFVVFTEDDLHSYQSVFAQYQQYCFLINH